MFGKKGILGIDIGSKVIKILELNVSGKKVSVTNYAEYDIGSQAVEEKSPEERKQAYADSLKRLVSNKKFSTKNAAISVSGSSVIVRFVKFPKMSAGDLEKTLQFEAEPHIPFDIQEVYLDTQIIRDIEEEEEVKMETVLVASKKETVQDKIDIIQAAGFNPKVIDVDAFAVENAYEFMNSGAPGDVVMLINIGASITNISIVENGVSKVVRDLYTAGNSFTHAIRELMQNTLEEAEQLKIKYGMLRGAGENEGEGGMGEQVFNIMYPVVKELNSEIQRSIDYFSGQQAAGGMNIKQIILSGGSAGMKGLPELITSDIRIPVSIFSPLKNADKSSLKDKIDVNSPALAVVTGLALRKAGDNKKAGNTKKK
ncbi:MAG: type IV pilus assembly protein PilM [Elusimicrobiota bacterium]